MESTSVDTYASGIHEFLFGCAADARETFERYWEKLGFTAAEEGRLTGEEAEALYGYRCGLTSVLLEHSGCRAANGGYVRLQCWDRLRNDGIGMARPLAGGSRWMGMYTSDVLSLHDAFDDSRKRFDKAWWVSPVCRAALEWPEPEFDFVNPFVGLRELVVLTEFSRHAFIQRVGFDRPGFGTIDESLPYRNSEGTHANLVQPIGGFDPGFYKTVFGWVTAPFGEAEDFGDKPSTQAVLNMEPDQVARMERIKSPHSESGMLQVYATYSSAQPTVFDATNFGARGLDGYTVCMADIEGARERAGSLGADWVSEILPNEFGCRSFSFIAPDHFGWSVVEHVA